MPTPQQKLEYLAKARQIFTFLKSLRWIGEAFGVVPVHKRPGGGGDGYTTIYSGGTFDQSGWTITGADPVYDGHIVKVTAGSPITFIQNAGNHIDGTFSLDSFSSTLDNLYFVGTGGDNPPTVSVNNLTALTSLGFDTLGLSPVSINNLVNLTTLALPGNQWDTIDLSIHPLLNNVNLSFNIFDTSQINKALTDLVANGLSNGYVDLSGQTPPAPPSGAGAAAVITLTGLGWTVITD